MPEGIPVTSVTKCSPDVTEPQPPKISPADVPKLQPAEISPDVQKLRPGSLEEAI